MAAAAAGGGSSSGSIATVVAQGRHKVQLTMLKPPTDLQVSSCLVLRGYVQRMSACATDPADMGCHDLLHASEGACHMWRLLLCV
jgi:hypothetical protein